MLQSAPEALVEQGKFNVGKYKTPFKTVNFQQSENPYWIKTDFVKNIQTREWQAFQVNNEQYFVMIAIYNAKKISLLQCIIFDKTQQKKYKYEAKVSPLKMSISNGLYNTKSSYHSKHINYNIEHDIEQHWLSIRIEWKMSKDLPALIFHVEGNHNIHQYEPLVVCLPFSEKRAMYSHKCLMPAKGNMQLGNENIVFLPENSSIIIDDHKGYYPYVTRYNWVTALGFDKNKNRIGLNITHNQALNPEKFNENCLWINGKLIDLPFCTFQRENGDRNTWQISDSKHRVQLKFTPKVDNFVHMNVLLFHSNYYGPYGELSGTIQMEDGSIINIENLFAMGEIFYLRL